MALAAYDKIRAGLVKIQGKLGVPVTLYGVGSTSSHSASTGAATESGGTDVTLTAAVHSASENSVAAGLAEAGDLVAVIPEADLSAAAGAGSQPHQGMRVLANGDSWRVRRVEKTVDDAGTPTHFTLALQR